MTPDKARDLLDGTTPGPWQVDPRHAGEVLSPENHWLAGTYETADQFSNDDLARAQSDTRLIAAAPDMAAMIAGMREEWGVKWGDDPNGPPDWGFPTRAAAEQWEKANRHHGPGRGHAVRRYVTEPEKNA